MTATHPVWISRPYRAAGEVVAALAVLGLLAVAGPVLAQEDFQVCGDPFTNATGPYDYNDPIARTTSDQIPIVEQYHFNADVESLTQGQSSTILGDLEYTLRAVPNHHRALNAMARLDLEKGGIPLGKRSADCWFDRAKRFRPGDGVVWLIYGNYKARKKQPDEALEGYLKAKELMPSDVEVDYNLGLLYFGQGDFEKSVAHARIAYAGNYPLQGLRRKLAEKGYSLAP